MKKFSLLLFVLILFISVDAWSQGCSTCTAVANNLDNKSAKGLNTGIIYLAITPLLFMFGTAYWWYRKNYKHKDTTAVAA